MILTFKGLSWITFVLLMSSAIFVIISWSSPKACAKVVNTLILSTCNMPCFTFNPIYILFQWVSMWGVSITVVKFQKLLKNILTFEYSKMFFFHEFGHLYEISLIFDHSLQHISQWIYTDRKTFEPLLSFRFRNFNVYSQVKRGLVCQHFSWSMSTIGQVTIDWTTSWITLVWVHRHHVKLSTLALIP